MGECSTSTEPSGPTARRRARRHRCCIRSSDPFAPEVVAVPTRGIERWLTQRLSTRLGATRSGRAPTASARTSSSRSRGRLVGAALARASGIDPEQDPWLPERVGLAAARGRRGVASSEPWLAPLARPPRRRARRPRGPAPVRRPSATSPTCSTATRCTGRSMLAGLGARRGPARATRRRLAGRAVAAAARRGSACRARPSGSSRRLRAAARRSPELVDAAGRGSRCSD